MILRFVAAACTAGVLSFSAPAFAGRCPADKMVADGSGQPKSDAKAAGVTDDVLATIDLSKEPAMVQDRLLRLRKLTIKPGGVVPWHSHGDRPAIITIITGEVYEYSSSCGVPILHKAGDTTTEMHNTQHWWKNAGTKTVVLFSADLFPTKTSSNAHQM